MLIEMAWWVCLTLFRARRYLFRAPRLSLSELDLQSDLMPALDFCVGSTWWFSWLVLVFGRKCYKNARGEYCAWSVRREVQRNDKRCMEASETVSCHRIPDA